MACGTWKVLLHYSAKINNTLNLFRLKEAEVVLAKGASFLGGEGLPEKFDLHEMVLRRKKEEEKEKEG